MVSRAFEPVHDTGPKQGLSNLTHELGGAWEIEEHERSIESEQMWAYHFHVLCKCTLVYT